MGATLADIAKRANVSTSTVSRVISDHPGISEETKKKVQIIMKELKYQPNMAARSLANKSTKTIGIVFASRTEGALVKSFKYPRTTDIIGGLSITAYKNNYNLLLSSLNRMENDDAKIRELAMGGITDGIVYYFSRVNYPIIELLKKCGTPFVVIGRPLTDADMINWVDTDNFDSAYKLTEMMIKAGRKKIAFAGASPNFSISIDKVEGYKKALIDNGYPVNENLIIPGRFITENGYELMKKIIGSGIVPDAIIAQDDILAFGMMNCMNERGYRIPEDISVASFDNIPTSEFSTPALTTVDTNAYTQGVKACEMLLSKIKDEKMDFTNIIVPSEIKKRNSI